jgi:hypothetical protein
VAVTGDLAILGHIGNDIIIIETIAAPMTGTDIVDVRATSS